MELRLSVWITSRDDRATLERARSAIGPLFAMRGGPDDEAEGLPQLPAGDGAGRGKMATRGAVEAMLTGMVQEGIRRPRLRWLIAAFRTCGCRTTGQGRPSAPGERQTVADVLGRAAVALKRAVAACLVVEACR